MAKKLSKKQRKQQKQKQLNVIKRYQKQSGKTFENLSNNGIENLYKSIVAEQQKQQKIKAEKQAKKEETIKKQSESRAKKLEFKKESLWALGFDKKWASRVKYEDIEAYKNGDETALGIEKYPFLYESHGFDFDKVYSFGDKGLYIAWLDYYGEHSIEDLLVRYATLSNETLIQILEGIINEKCTYNKDAVNRGIGTSSGRAGGVNIGFHSEVSAKIMYDSDNRKIDKSLENENLKRVHSGINKYYQLLTTGDNYTIKEISGRRLLIVLNAIFYNITENDRKPIYRNLYNSIVSRVSEFKKILPKPPKKEK